MSSHEHPGIKTWDGKPSRTSDSAEEPFENPRILKAGLPGELNEDLSMTRVVFFQVSDSAAKLKKIVETVNDHFRKNEPFLFFVEDEKALNFVDELLWKYPETSFLPHAATEEPTQERIAITKTKSNVNKALYAFNLCPTPLLIHGFKIIYDFEDLTAPNKKSFSSLRFNAYKQAKMPIVQR